MARYNWNLATGDTLKQLLLAYKPQSNPIQDAHTASYYHTESTYYPLFMLNYFMVGRERKTPVAKGQRKRKPARNQEFTFIRYTLNAAQKKEAKAYMEKSSDELDALVTDVLKTGHKISFSYNETNDQITCTFTGKKDESLNEFRMLTSHASSWWQALAVNLYKHHEIFSAEIWEDLEEEDEFG